MTALFIILTLVYYIILYVMLRDISKSKESDYDRLRSMFYKRMASYEDRHSSYCKGLNKEIRKLKIQIEKIDGEIKNTISNNEIKK